MMANGSPPELVAEVIYAATTDGTDQLGYEASGAPRAAVALLSRDAFYGTMHRMWDMIAFFGLVRAEFESQGPTFYAEVERSRSCEMLFESLYEALRNGNAPGVLAKLDPT
jgi:hypothetical protein